MMRNGLLLERKVVSQRANNRLRRSFAATAWLALSVWLAMATGLPLPSGLRFDSGPSAHAQQPGETKIGYQIDVPVPLESRAASTLLDQLVRLGEGAPEGERTTVVLRYADHEPDAGRETAFEDALKVARALAQPELRQLRVVSLVECEVIGHSVLPIIASDLLLVSGDAVIGNASAGESSSDETIQLTYQSIAARRGLFPPAIIEGLVDRDVEVAEVSKVGGGRVFAAGDELKRLREASEVLEEESWSASGAPLVVDAVRLRSARIAAASLDSIDEAAEILDLAELNPISDRVAAGEAAGVYLEISGVIARNRARRWQSNLSSTLDAGNIDTWVISIDSAGGSLSDSASLAGWFAQPEPPLRSVAGLIRGEARGDAALIALSCKPLFMTPDSRIGGEGAEQVSPEQLERYRELIEEVGRSTKRSPALMLGMLDPQLEVFRYTNRKTGRVRYATEADLIANVDDPDAERERWERGERIDLSEGLTAAEAINLGLADGESRSVEDTSRRVGLSGTPPPVTDRGFIQFVEDLGRSNTLAFFLLFIGFSALSAEANAPGLSFPGFIALVCFALYFWMKFLAGTAEWLELVCFSLGIICIAIEIFLVPGFGVFGIGGLALTVLGVVLMSQTFVIPKNTYQLEVLTQGVWLALGGTCGLVGGFLLMRIMLPHVPLFRGLVMEASDEAMISEQEKIVDYSYLLGRQGTATTPLRPSGKAKFGDEVVQVVSDGSALSEGELVHVIEVHANRVVVEAIEA